jgi:hypothetical protein
MNNGSPRRPVSGRGLPLLFGHFIAEMGNNELGEFTTKQTDLSFLTNQNNKTNIIIPLTYQNAPSLLESSAEMKGNVHVLPSWMMAKAKQHMDVRSLPLRRRYCLECRITLD